jgi:RecB family exonuclease
MPRKPTLSPTRIAAYLDCAMKYRYIFGSTLHNVLQTFHAEGAVKTREELAADVEQRWISAGYESTEQEAGFRAAGQEIIHAYHAAAQERAARAVETLFTEKTITADMGPFRLQGRVDRIDRHPDGTLEIIDYKSGRLEVTAEEVRDSLAMSVYQLILRRMYPGSRVVSTIYALRSGAQASSEMSAEEAERFGEDILVLGEEILGRDYENIEPQPVPACDGCDFLSLCQRHWRLTQ